MLTEEMKKAIKAFINTYPLVHVHPMSYGTAGFRTKGHLLIPVAARVIFIAVLRSWWAFESKGGRSRIGFMITASHNPAEDNGFKIIDYNGEMLESSWEEWCTRAANAATGEELLAVVQDCASKFDISPPSLVEYSSTTSSCVIHLGRDTRTTGEDIVKAVVAALSLPLNTTYVKHGLVTTPQLHFIVYTYNEIIAKEEIRGLASKNVVGVTSYHEAILQSFESLMKRACGDRKVHRKIVVDTANGVGYYALRNLIDFSRSKTPDVLGTYFDFMFVNKNVDDPNALNLECGADYAKQTYKPSTEMQQQGERQDADTHYYCVDGDADRLVAFAYDGAEKKWGLLDGDRIAILYAKLMDHLMDEKARRCLNVGIVQTGYANGASTAYVRDALHLTSYLAATGVKNLHPVAHACDVGVYFEANGHGTVLVNEEHCHRTLSVADRSASTTAPSVFVEEVVPQLRQLVSQLCGDAIGDLLLCEVALAALQLRPAEWLALYEDRPSRLSKVRLEKPVRMVTSADEQQVLDPSALQEKINSAIAEALQELEDLQKASGSDKKVAARAFVRPSGTEPIVRVYAEASDEAVCMRLSNKVEKIVADFLAPAPPPPP